MCAVSFVSDYYQDKWNDPIRPNVYPWTSDPELKDLMKDIIKKLDSIDKKLGDTECKDDKKQLFLESLDLDMNMNDIKIG